MLRASGVEVTVGRRTLLHGIDAAVAPGERVALVGPNGAGKSTLLGALAGSQELSAGEVSLAGIPIQRWDARGLARRRAVLTQHPRVAFAFSAADVVGMGRWPHPGGHGGPASRRLARLALGRVGAGALADSPLNRLSGGERQRIHLARILCQLMDRDGAIPAGRFALLDEPTASLDPAWSLGILELVRALGDAGVGVLIVLHDLNLAARIADRILVLDGGRIVAEGPPSAALSPDHVARAFDMEVATVPHPADGGPVLIPLRRRPPQAADPHASLTARSAP